MKKIPALVFLSILLVNTTGFYVYYIIALQRIHAEMRARLRTLPEEQLTRLILLRETYEASRVEADEIQLDGKMYDVARVSHQGDSVIVLAMHDDKEENFMCFANEIISKPFKKDSNVTGSVLQFIVLMFLPGQHVILFNCKGTIVEHRSDQLLLIGENLLTNNAPPPRIKS